MADNKPLNIDVFQNVVTNYVVTPLNAFGLGGFVFDTEGETNVQLTAEITDHFVEDGSTISDHIAIKPKKITLKNYVGELVYRQDDSTDTPVQKVVQKLTTVNSYLPEITAMAQQVLDLKKADSLSKAVGDFTLNAKTINRVSDFWALAKNLMSGSSRQGDAYRFFKAMWQQKLLVSVQTPFEFMNSMAIESITAIQEENEKYVSNFSITLKEIRTSKDLYSPQGTVTDLGVGSMEDYQVNMQGRAPIQSAGVSNQGNIPGVRVPAEEIIKEIKNMGIDISLDNPGFNLP